MKRILGTRGDLSPERRRRLLQLIFVFINLALVEVHLPGPLWLAVGGIFWLALIGVSVAGSNVVCGTMCWIGAIQDIFEPFARPRVRLDARLGRSLTFALLILWMPIGWLVLPSLAAHDRMPLDAGLGWERHAFQFALAAVVAASVLFLGKRGICRYLCPFNSIVAAVRRGVRAIVPSRTARTFAPSIVSTACAGGCNGCSRRDGALPAAAYERISNR
jgi:polyferredoxin